jgi:hypothetical protein
MNLFFMKTSRCIVMRRVLYYGDFYKIFKLREILVPETPLSVPAAG